MQYGERCPRSVNRTAGPRTLQEFFFFSLLLKVLPFMHGAYAPERGNPADWRWKRAALRVFPYRAVGKRKGPDFIWGWQEDEWKRYKVTIRIRDELVCMQEFTGGGDIHSFGCGG